MATVVVQKPASATVTVSEVNNSVAVTQFTSNIVEVSATGPSVVITQPSANNVVEVEATAPSVVVTQPSDSRIVEIASAGPAGPPFTGVHYFDLTEIAALGASDEGKVLNWNGNIFVPTNDLSANLTLNGGAF